MLHHKKAESAGCSGVRGSGIYYYRLERCGFCEILAQLLRSGYHLEVGMKVASEPSPALSWTLPSNSMMGRVGVFLSIGCAVHCALMPFVMGMLAVSGFLWVASETTEWAIVGSTFLVGGVRIGYSYLRLHRNLESLYWFILGASFILVARLGFGVASWEPMLMVLGGLLIATAHFRNERLCAHHRATQVSLVRDAHAVTGSCSCGHHH